MRKIETLTIVILIVIMMMSGCAVRLVSQYDADTEKAIVDTAKKTDLFYGKLLELPQDKRSYASLSDQYISIENDIRTLILRNEARNLNTESTMQSKILLNLWLQFKNDHMCRHDKSKMKNDSEREELNKACIKWKTEKACAGFIEECGKKKEICEKECRDAEIKKWSESEIHDKDIYKTAAARIDRLQMRNAFLYMLMGEKFKKDSDANK